jgi:hypothetical protein
VSSINGERYNVDNVVGWWFAEGIELEVAMKAQNILFLFIMLLDSIRLVGSISQYDL